jgi:hypothetical protein
MTKNKKTLVLIISMMLFNANAFSYDPDIIDNPFDFSLGRSKEEIKSNNGPPEKENTYFASNNKYTYLFYGDMRISVWHYSADSQFISVRIFSPKISVLNGICVGLSIEEVLCKLGKPDGEGTDRIFYRGNTHYLLFEIDQFKQILSITWEYFLD